MGTFAQMLDITVKDWPVEEALGYAQLALKCTEMRWRDRSDLATVVLLELNRLRNLGHARVFLDTLGDALIGFGTCLSRTLNLFGVQL